MRYVSHSRSLDEDQCSKGLTVTCVHFYTIGASRSFFCEGQSPNEGCYGIFVPMFAVCCLAAFRRLYVRTYVWRGFNQESAPELSCVQVDLFGRLSHQESLTTIVYTLTLLFYSSKPPIAT